MLDFEVIDSFFKFKQFIIENRDINMIYLFVGLFGIEIFQKTFLLIFFYFLYYRQVTSIWDDKFQLLFFFIVYDRVVVYGGEQQLVGRCYLVYRYLVWSQNYSKNVYNNFLLKENRLIFIV